MEVKFIQIFLNNEATSNELICTGASLSAEASLSALTSLSMEAMLNVGAALIGPAWPLSVWGPQ